MVRSPGAKSVTQAAGTTILYGHLAVNTPFASSCVLQEGSVVPESQQSLDAARNSGAHLSEESSAHASTSTGRRLLTCCATLKQGLQRGSALFSAAGRVSLRGTERSAAVAATDAFPGVWSVQRSVLTALRFVGARAADATEQRWPFASARRDGIESLSLQATSPAGGSLEGRRKALSILITLHHVWNGGDAAWRREVVPQLVAARHAEATAAALCSLLRPEALRIGGATISGGGSGGGETSPEGDSCRDWSDVRMHIFELASFLTLGGESLLAARFGEHCSRGEIMPGVVAAIIVAIRAETQFWAAEAAAAATAVPPRPAEAAAAAASAGELPDGRSIVRGTDLLDAPRAFAFCILGLLKRILPDEVDVSAAIHNSTVQAVLEMIEALMGMDVDNLELRVILRALSLIVNFLLCNPPDDLTFAARRTALHIACLWRPVLGVPICRAAGVTGSLAIVRKEACFAVDVLQQRIGPAVVDRCWLAEPEFETGAFVAACRALVGATGGAVAKSDCDDTGADIVLSADKALQLLRSLLPLDCVAAPAMAALAVELGVAGAISEVRCVACFGLCE